MGKLICEPSTAVGETAFQTPTSAWRDPPETTQPLPLEFPESTWHSVIGLEEQQIRHLQKIHSKGVLWKPPPPSSAAHGGASPPNEIVFRLSHGGEVSADGNCLFTALVKAMAPACEVDARELRRRTVRRFVEDYGGASEEEKEAINDAVKHMYSADVKNGWGIHVVQEVKVLVKKEERANLDSCIDELLQLGMQREMAAESIYKERGIPVDDGHSWAKYMSTSGSPDGEFDIITLQYTEEGLLSVDENRGGHAAAFGDDIAIECLATEFKREIYVVQAHGSDTMADEENCIFFLPHRPRCEICELPLFLFMKGTGWCGAGADHYEPLIAEPSSLISHEKVAIVL